MSEKTNNDKDCFSCPDCCICIYYKDVEQWWNERKTKIAGKIGIFLSILNSVFIILDVHYPASIAKYIVAALISAGVFIGGLMYDRLAREHEQLADDNVSKQDIIRRFTMFAGNNSNAILTIPSPLADTPQSDDTVEPINFEAMHVNNIRQTAINEYTFPTD